MAEQETKTVKCECKCESGKCVCECTCEGNECKCVCG